MNRIITILVTIFILLLLYIWISHVWGSDKPQHPRQIVDATHTEQTLGADDTTSDVDTFVNTSPDMVSDEHSTQEETNSAVAKQVSEPAKTEEVKSEPVTNATVKNEPVKKEVVAEKKSIPAKPVNNSKKVSSPSTAAKTSEPVTKKTSLSASTEGKHLVIAGNFLQRVNAEQRMQELKKAGFENVEIVNFDLSEYHTVCAGRFADVNEARRLVKKLKDFYKVDAYVRVGS